MRVFTCLVLGATLLVAGCGSGPKGPPAWNPNVSGPPRDENYHGGPNATLLKYDANHDGTLTREELLAGLKAEFDGYDTKKSGCLDDDQVAAINQARIAADQSTATPLMDWNHDGCVDFHEFATAPVSLFDQIDKNGDGKITPQEFDPHAKPKPGAAQTKAPNNGGGRRGRRGGGNGGTPPDSGDGGTPPDGGNGTTPPAQ